MPSTRQRPKSDQGGDGPVTVIVGDEELLVERAVAAVVSRRTAPADGSGVGVTGSGGVAGVGGVAGRGGLAGPDVHDVRGADLGTGELGLLTAPSLFGGGCVVVIRSAHDANSAVAAEIGALAAAMPEDVTL